MRGRSARYERLATSRAPKAERDEAMAAVAASSAGLSGSVTGAVIQVVTDRTPAGGVLSPASRPPGALPGSTAGAVGGSFTERLAAVPTWLPGHVRVPGHTGDIRSAIDDEREDPVSDTTPSSGSVTALVKALQTAQGACRRRR